MAKLIIPNRFGVAPNDILNDNKLSFGAKGLYAYLQSKPENWRFSVERMGSQTKEGRTAIKSSIKELEKANLLKRKPARSINGKWNGYDYTLYEKPLTENPSTVKPLTENIVTLSKKDISKKDIVNKNKNLQSKIAGINEIFEIFYKQVNPVINFGNKTSRDAAGFLINKFGLEETKKIAKFSCSVQGKEYVPIINTPYQLKEKLASLKTYTDRLKAKQKKKGMKILWKKTRGKDKKPRIRKAYKGRVKISGYWYIYSPEHPNRTVSKYVAEHRLVAEELVGRYLKPYEDVHHIDGNKENNNINNLEVILHSEHSVRSASIRERDTYGRFK